MHPPELSVDGLRVSRRGRAAMTTVPTATKARTRIVESHSGTKVASDDAGVTAKSAASKEFQRPPITIYPASAEGIIKIATGTPMIQAGAPSPT